MSENPFLAPQSSSAANFKNVPVGAKAPGALTAILIICLIIGCLGILGSCWGSIGTVLNTVIMQSTSQVNPKDPGEKFAKSFQEANQAATIPNLILILINFIISPMMFAGALGCLNRKAWGQRLLRLSLIAGTVFVLIRLVVGMVIQFKLKSTVVDGFANSLNKGGPDPKTMAAMMEGFFWLGVVVGLVWALAQAAFYVWSFIYLNRTEVRNYLKA